MSYLTRIGGLIAVAALLLGAGRYIGHKLHVSFGLMPFWAWILVVMVVTIGAMVAMTGSIIHQSTAATRIYWISGIIVALLLYLLLALLLVDLISLATDRSQSVRLLLATIIAVLVTGYGIWHAYDTKIAHQTFVISGLMSPIRAVHLTDTHFGHTRGVREAQKLVRMINALDPDVIFFTGDMFDSRKALHAAVFDAFAEIQAPVYFIEGNHDIHVGVDPIKQAMRERGITVLENEMTSFGELTIIGLNHMVADAQSRSVHVYDMSHTVQSVLEALQSDPDAPTVLLHHSPDGLEYAAAAGVDLFLAGHTHAGQLFPITIIAKYLFTQNRGHYIVDGMDAYICSGTGTFGPAVRVATRSEICVLELVPGE